MNKEDDKIHYYKRQRVLGCVMSAMSRVQADCQLNLQKIVRQEGDKGRRGGGLRR